MFSATELAGISHGLGTTPKTPLPASPRWGEGYPGSNAAIAQNIKAMGSLPQQGKVEEGATRRRTEPENVNTTADREPHQ